MRSCYRGVNILIVFCLAMASLMLNGCSTQKKEFAEKSFHISVSEDFYIKPQGMARLVYDDKGVLKSCHIVLKHYPTCLLHELRHCIEGDWHPRDEPNTEDC